MKFLSNIPRGLVLFLGAIIIVIVVVLGYRALFTGGSSSTNGGGGNSLFSALFPFGNSSQPGNNGTAGAAPLAVPQESGAVPILRQISTDPVSGGWFVKSQASTSPPSIRFMDRQSGHIEETPADSFTKTRISNTTLPGIQELYAAGDAALVVRVLGDAGDIQNFFGVLNATSSEQSLNTSPLRAFDRATLAAGGSIVTVTETAGGSRIELSKADGTKLQTLFSSPITSWVPLTGGARTFVETAPTAAAQGYLYEIKGQGSAATLVKIAGGGTGFAAAVSPSGRYVASSENTAGGFSFSVLDTKTGSVSASPIHALALKCAWIPSMEPLLFCAVPQNPPSGAYPDDWLIGNTSFSDEAWIINPAKNTSYFVGLLADQDGAGIDAERVTVDANGSYALFMNKKDLSLWSLNITDAVLRAQGK